MLVVVEVYVPPRPDGQARGWPPWTAERHRRAPSTPEKPRGLTEEQARQLTSSVRGSLHAKTSLRGAHLRDSHAGGPCPGRRRRPDRRQSNFSFPADCGGQTVQFVLNGNGDFTPAHVVGSTTVYVVQSFNVTFEFTPTGGETMSETAARSKGNVHGELVTCTFDVRQSVLDGTFTFFGTATGFFTPAS
jgi:hypothetical protein